MCGGNCSADGQLVIRFSTTQKLYFRMAFYGFVVLGLLGICKQDPLGALGYLVICLLGMCGLNWSLCQHCPYPEKYQSCVFMPYFFVLRFFPYKGPRMGTLKKIVFTATMLIMMAVPYIWLVNDILILFLYTACCLALGAGFIGYLCRRCRHVDCPSNRLCPDEKLAVLEEMFNTGEQQK